MPLSRITCGHRLNSFNGIGVVDSHEGMDYTRRGILALARTLGKKRTWVKAEDSIIQRRFISHDKSDVVTNGSRKLGFHALGAVWSIEPVPVATSGGLSAVRVSCGDTVVLAQLHTIDDSGPMYTSRPFRASRMPTVSVEYKEHYHAKGKFPPVFDRKETLITFRERRIAAQIQNAVESMIVPESHSKQHVWMKLSVLSSHEDCDSEIVAINAASTALALSPDIKWYGPVGAVRIFFQNEDDNRVSCHVSLRASHESAEGYVKDNYGNATTTDEPSSMMVIGTQNGLVYACGHSREINPKYVKEGLQVGHTAICEQLLAHQLEFSEAKTGTGKGTGQIVLRGADPAAARRIQDQVDTLIAYYLESSYSKGIARFEDYMQSTLVPNIKDFCSGQGRWRSQASRIKGSGCATIDDVLYVSKASIENNLNRRFWKNGTRPDGRTLSDILPGSVETGGLPLCHGSSVYSAGGTSIITAVTCGSLSEASNTEYTISGSTPNRVSSLCVLNESKAHRNTRVHDLNVSNLLTSTFSRILPETTDLPFAFRISTEIIDIDGCLLSSCVNGAAMAMKNIGVRLQHPLGSATVGLASDSPERYFDGEEQTASFNDRGLCEKPKMGAYSLIVDPSGLESFGVDATLTTSGSSSKLSSWTFECNKPIDISLEMTYHMIDLALKSQKSHVKNLGSQMKGQDLSRPKFGQLIVHPATIPKLQNERGVILRDIEAKTGGIIHVEDNGQLKLFAPSSTQYEMLEEAIVQAAGANLVPGRVYKAKVTTIKDFGAFVELPGSDIEALLHISEISSKRIVSVEDELSMLQEVDVLFQGRDKMGNLRVSLKAATDKMNNMNE